MKRSLDGEWRLYTTDNPVLVNIAAEVPGTVYSALMKAGRLRNPYYRLNECEAIKLAEENYTFEKSFDLSGKMKFTDKVLLKFYGIDTAAQIVLNDMIIGETDNMHREYVFDVTGKLMPDGNVLRVNITSPLKYIADRNAKEPLWGVSSTTAGFPHIRKAHYMFGWDWGPCMPDMGIWRGVELIGVQGGIIDGVFVKQDHSRVSEGKVSLETEVTVGKLCAEGLSVIGELTAPDGSVISMSAELGGGKKVKLSCTVDNAQLWFPRGYGGQPLYYLSVRLMSGEDTADEYETNIGLRTVNVSRAADSGGEEFAFVVNGVRIFARGANYIPEDQIIPVCSPADTERLLKQCCIANFNMIRVWGGGYYPEDYFYKLCDRMGLLVWQDLMFACAVYKADVAFCENVKHEIADNVKRIRNHPCLAMWCGNNEIESMWQYWGIDADPEYKKDYLRLFEALIPKILEFYDPVTFYHPSSPSSGGGFNDSGAVNKGDAHYWDVWHGLKPFTDYKKYKFRFCSEFGFESLPSMKTIRTFAEEYDLDLMSPVMESHHKCEAGSEKLMYYLAQLCNYPRSFEALIYATQFVQAEAVRLGVEHMRRNRGVCMGALYWQVNDSNPAISWSSIDYYGRWKALHYAAKRFYAPVIISADDSEKDKIILNVSSERQVEFTGLIRWRSRRNTGEIIAQGISEVEIKPLAAENHVTVTFAEAKITPDMKDRIYIEYSLLENGMRLSGGTYLPVPPKHFSFLPPRLTAAVTESGSKFKIIVSGVSFAKGVCLELADRDCVFSDNWFDIHGDTASVYVSKTALPKDMTAHELSAAITVKSYYDQLAPGEK